MQSEWAASLLLFPIDWNNHDIIVHTTIRLKVVNKINKTIALKFHAAKIINFSISNYLFRDK